MSAVFLFSGDPPPPRGPRWRRDGRLVRGGGAGVADVRARRERNAASIQLVSDLCDLTVPATALGFVNLDDGIVGLAGTLSSLLGVYTVWKKTA